VIWIRFWCSILDLLSLLLWLLTFRGFILGTSLWKIIAWELRNLIWFFGKHCNWCTYRNEIISWVYLCDEALFLYFKSNSSLISFDLSDCIPRLNFISLFHQPFYDFTLFHRRRESRHLGKEILTESSSCFGSANDAEMRVLRFLRAAVKANLIMVDNILKYQISCICLINYLDKTI
jgi:hypothetical protein